MILIKGGFRSEDLPNFSREAGFTIIELLVSVAVIAMVMLAVLSGVAFSVRNTRISIDRSAAVRHAQKAVEWARSTRDSMGWTAFVDVVETSGGSYCMPSLPATGTDFASESGEASCGVNEKILNASGEDTVYDRLVVLSKITDDEVDVSVTVAWQDGNDTRSTTAKTSLRKFE